MSVKRRDLIRYLETNGFRLLREGGNHSIYTNNSKTLPVKRHGQIDRITANEICKQAGVLACSVSAAVTTASADESIRAFGTPIDNKSDIRKMLFRGFKKCLYRTQKFDSDPERRFAVLLEQDPAVMKWFKPGKGVFQIRYTADHDYEPDFVVETEAEKLLCEPKRADRMQDPVVVAKARAAATWCEHATAHEIEHEGKPWRYVLIPHDAIRDNMTVAGLSQS